VASLIMEAWILLRPDVKENGVVHNRSGLREAPASNAATRFADRAQKMKFGLTGNPGVAWAPRVRPGY